MVFVDGQLHAGESCVMLDIIGIYHPLWVNYNELTTTSLEIIVSKGNHPQMALFQVSELL